jgi:hypothetical protein
VCDAVGHYSVVREEIASVATIAIQLQLEMRLRGAAPVPS